MLSICPLIQFSETDLKTIEEYGFQSTLVFDVSSTQSSEGTLGFELVPRVLQDALVHKWPIAGFEMTFFKTQIKSGHALGLYHQDQSDSIEVVGDIGEAVGTGIDDLIGLVICQPVPWNNTLHISVLHVAEKHRRSGGGRLLLDAAEALSQNLGLAYVTLETQNINGNAIGFYLHCGYEITGMDIGKYRGTAIGQDHVAIFMQKKL